MLLLREAVDGDAESLATLWSRYLEEHYAIAAGVSAAQLRRDALGVDRRVNFVVAEDARNELRGALAWRWGYDLHHFVRGVDALSARAFRALADLAGASPREICQKLPPRAGNHEP